MNKCSFYGKIIDFRLDTLEDNDCVGTFALEVFSKRFNNPSAKPDRQILNFEVWGTAADFLSAKVREQEHVNILICDSTAKSDLVDSNFVMFRVNDFKII